VLVQAGHDLDERRLAGTVVTEDAGDLAGVDLEVDALQRIDVAVGLADVFHDDEGLDVGRAPRRGLDAHRASAFFLT
jgi:hypothetical protein